jgi:2-polyprenyl-3-methyl-5-hydroxy-6-metoxy-1,4-benzoquinol methylase
MNESESVRCDICGSDRTEHLYSVAECTGACTGEMFNLVKCRKCGLAYVNPRPTAEELPKYYPQESYYAYRGIENEKESLKSRIKNFLAEWAGGYKIDQSKRVFGMTTLFTWIVKVGVRNVLIGIVPYKKGARLLDVGCGNGGFLKWHKEHGWDVYGVEINEAAASIAQRAGLNVFTGEVAEANYPAHYFDVCTCIQALEHVPSPSALLRELHRVLKRNGLLLIGVPNFGCFDRKLFRQDWTPLEIPRHLYHFEVTTLRKLLETNGFEIEDIRAKGFWLPGLRNLSISRNPSCQGPMQTLSALLKLIVLKPILILFSRQRKENFSVLLAFYARKIMH